jgi:dephospho-CoA kinase
MMRAMLRVGLTGNIGSGKSTAALIFGELGAHVIDADEIVHMLLEPGSEVHKKVRQDFGEGVIRSDGTIDRRKLGELVFASSEKRQLLNGLIHPAVRTFVWSRIEKLEQSIGNGIVIVDAALMVETGFYRQFDRVIVVHCDDALQISRVMERDGFDLEDARARIAAQMPSAEKLKAADYAIETSGTLRQTRVQVEAIYRELQVLERRMTREL